MYFSYKRNYQNYSREQTCSQSKHAASKEHCIVYSEHYISINQNTQICY